MMLALGREDYARCGRVADRLHMSRRTPATGAGVAQRRRHDGLELLASGPLARRTWRSARPRPPDSPEIEAVRFTLNLVDHRIAGRATDQPDTERKPARRPRHARDVRPRAPSGSWPTRRHPAGQRPSPNRGGSGSCARPVTPSRRLSYTNGLALAEWAHVWLHAMVGPEILIDLGRATEAAREAVGRGRELTHSKWVTRVRDAQRVDRGQDGDPAQPGPPRRIGGAGATARIGKRRPSTALSAKPRTSGRGWRCSRSVTTTVPLTHLERAVATMTASGSHPRAADRGGVPEQRRGGARAMKMEPKPPPTSAFDAASRQGCSNHYLLQALASFPSVVMRRLDAEPRADSPWHDLGRALELSGRHRRLALCRPSRAG